MNELSGVIIELPKISARIEPQKALSGNLGAKIINIGEDGATFTPIVSEDGILSWSNDKDLPNPEPVNIMGKKGEKGDKGDKGDRGEQGIQGIPGAKGDTGATGAQGPKGDTGADGKDGYTPQKGVDYFTASDIAEMVADVIFALPVYDGEVVTE